MLLLLHLFNSKNQKKMVVALDLLANEWFLGVVNG